MRFSRQEYWSGLPFPSPEDLPNPGIEPGFPALQVDALLSEPPGKPFCKQKGTKKKKKKKAANGAATYFQNFSKLYPLSLESDWYS